MNLEQLIDEAYGKYEADLKAEKEAQNLREQQEIEQAIAQFRSRFDLIISPELQKALGMNIRAAFHHPVYVDFWYKNDYLVISEWSSHEHWRVEKDGSFLCGGNRNVFLNLLLIELGKIRASFEPKSLSSSATEMLEKFNFYYTSIQAIAQGEEWSKLCEVLHDDPEVKTNLADVLHYLGEMIDDIKEVVQGES